MSAFIGDVKAPHSNSPNTRFRVFCSLSGVEINDLAFSEDVVSVCLDPIAARNYAALLVRAAEECERMRERADRENRTPLRPGEGT